VDTYGSSSPDRFNLLTTEKDEEYLKSSGSIKYIAEESHKYLTLQNNGVIGLDETKDILYQLFLSYCDYSLERGEIFMKQTTLLKLLKDSAFIGHPNINRVSLSQINIIICSQKKAAGFTNLDFQQFVNLIVAILKHQNGFFFKESGKEAIQLCVLEIFLPLLIKIKELSLGTDA